VPLDGARWQDIFDGAMPLLLDAAAARGAVVGAPDHGESVYASGPNFVSLPGYTEILTGRPPRACLDNECTGLDEDTILDEVVAAGHRAALFASWERLDRVAARAPAAVVWAGRHGRRGELPPDAELQVAVAEGERADPSPGLDDFRPDRYTAAAALRFLELQRPTFLFLGLGEPDEYAHRGDRDGYRASLRSADAILADLEERLAGMGERGRRTAIFVTADHGRAENFRDHGAFAPESSRVWLVALGAGIAGRGFVRAPARRHLADVAPTARALLGLETDRSAHAGHVLDELLTP
jgi:hypothetical protein